MNTSFLALTPCSGQEMVTLTRDLLCVCLSWRLGPPPPPPPSCRFTCDEDRTPKREFRKLTIRRGVLCLDDDGDGDGDETALSCCGTGTLGAGALLNLVTAG
jgi:hypothetical protein